MEVLQEEVKLSNTRTAYVLHIPNTFSLILPRNNQSENSNTISL